MGRNVNIAGYRKWFFLFSSLLVLGSIVLLSVPPALTPGIDFSGGAALTLEYDRDVTPEGVEDALRFVGHDEAVVQSTGPRSFFVRVGELAPGRPDSEGIVQPGDRDAVRGALNNLGDVTIVSFDNVSGIIGAENVRRAVISVIVAAVVILFYVTWAFRRVPSPFRYGAAAIVALLHDVLIVFGLFSLLGKTLGLEVNAMFITGVLTTIGYSVNDTIVVFDRVRENVGRFPAASVTEVVNLSVRETIGRSLNTSITLLIVVISLVLFASSSIHPLLFVLAAGVIVGTYSSICIASLILVSWENGEIGGFFSRIPLVGRRRRAAA